MIFLDFTSILVDIFISHYKKYTNKHMNVIDQSTYRDITCYIHNIIRYHRYSLYTIESITFYSMSIIYEKTVSLSTTDIEEIMNIIDEHIQDYIPSKDESILSINLSPFEGITITHNDIMSILDLFLI